MPDVKLRYQPVEWVAQHTECPRSGWLIPEQYLRGDVLRDVPLTSQPSCEGPTSRPRNVHELDGAAEPVGSYSNGRLPFLLERNADHHHDDDVVPMRPEKREREKSEILIPDASFS